MSSPKLTELHILSENEMLSDENGSAVLKVARGLAEAGRAVGATVRLGVSSAGLNGDGAGLVVLSKRNIPKVVRSVLKGVVAIDPGAPKVSLIDEFDVIIAHNQPWIGSQIARKAPTAKRVLWVHNKLLTGASPRVIRRTLRRFDLVVCVSDYIRTDLCIRGGLGDSALLTTVRNATAPLSSIAIARAVRPAYDLLFLGRVVPEKGVHHLLEALSRIATPLRVAIVGGATFHDGELTTYERRVREQAQDLSHSVSFFGPVSPAAVADALSDSVLVVVPSLWPEPSGLVILEAMLSGTPVVAHRVGGISEISAESGIELIDPDVGSLAEAIRRLLSDDGMLEQKSLAGIQFAQDANWPSAYAQFRSALSGG